MVSFKVGDTVRCLDTVEYTLEAPKIGQCYIVVAIEDSGREMFVQVFEALTLKPVGLWWLASRFKYV